MTLLMGWWAPSRLGTPDGPHGPMTLRQCPHRALQPPTLAGGALSWGRVQEAD